MFVDGGENCRRLGVLICVRVGQRLVRLFVYLADSLWCRWVALSATGKSGCGLSMSMPVHRFLLHEFTKSPKSLLRSSQSMWLEGFPQITDRHLVSCIQCAIRSVSVYPKETYQAGLYS